MNTKWFQDSTGGWSTIVAGRFDLTVDRESGGWVAKVCGRYVLTERPGKSPKPTKFDTLEKAKQAAFKEARAAAVELCRAVGVPVVDE